MLVNHKKWLLWIPAALLIIAAGVGYSWSRMGGQPQPPSFRTVMSSDSGTESGDQNAGGDTDAGGDRDAGKDTDAGKDIDAGGGVLPDAAGTDGLAETDRLTGPLIWVHVCGAVRAPGVYALPEGSRVQDGINAAGGFSDEADRNYLNLARLLSDAEKVYVPRPGEEVSADLAFGERPSSAASDGRININTATANELTVLPGVGQTRAEAIIAYREEHGFFQKPEDLMKVSGIGEGIYNRLSSKIKTGG